MDFVALEIVRSNLTIAYADNLVNVSAFSALTEITGSLVVQNNPELVSISGFDELVTLDTNLDVRGNTSLSECLPLELRNRLQDEGFDGTASISGNMADTCD